MLDWLTQNVENPAREMAREQQKRSRRKNKAREIRMKQEKNYGDVRIMAGHGFPFIVFPVNFSRRAVDILAGSEFRDQLGLNGQPRKKKKEKNRIEIKEK